MKKILLTAGLACVLIACSDAATEPPAEAPTQDEVAQNEEQNTNPSEETDEVNDSEETVDTAEEATTELSVADMLAQLVEQTSTIEAFQSHVYAEKQLRNGDVEMNGLIETNFRMANATNDFEHMRRVYYTSDVQAYETMYKEEGYYIAEDAYVTYNELTDAWTMASLVDFTQPNHFYLRPYDIAEQLLSVASLADYNYIDEHVVEFFFELDPAEHYGTLHQLTYVELSRNMPYFGGPDWAVTAEPLKIIMTADLQRGKIEQYIFRLTEEGIGEQQGLLETYFVQNFTYDDVEPIEIPAEVLEEANE